MSQESPYSPTPAYGEGPPVPQKLADELREPAQMNPIARLGTLLVSPGEVFEDIRRSPRDWYLPILVLIFISIGVGYFVQAKLNLTPDRMATAAIDMGLEQQGKSRADFTGDQAQQLQQQETVTKYIFQFAPILAFVFLPIGFAIVSAMYFGLTLVVQGKTTYFRLLSVVCYSYCLPNVVKALLQIPLAVMKSADDIDVIGYLQKSGLIQASPAAFVSPTKNAALYTLLSFVDVFSIWFLILATIGVATVCKKKLSMGSAAVVVFVPYLILMVFSVLMALIRG